MSARAALIRRVERPQTAADLAKVIAPQCAGPLPRRRARVERCGPGARSMETSLSNVISVDANIAETAAA